MSTSWTETWRGWMLRLARIPWAAIPRGLRERLPEGVRQWLERVAGYTVSTGRLGRATFRLLSPRREAAVVPERARVYLEEHRRHLAGGPEPTLAAGTDRDELLDELVRAIDEEERARLARGEPRGLRSLLPLLEKGPLVARIEEAGAPEDVHLLIAEPPRRSSS